MVVEEVVVCVRVDVALECVCELGGLDYSTLEDVEYLECQPLLEGKLVPLFFYVNTVLYDQNQVTY